jgi:hypothetical protein
MIPRAKFYGGSDERTFGADTALYVRGACVWTLDATAPGLLVELPDPVDAWLLKGGPQLLLVNAGANAFDVTTPLDTPTAIGAVAPGEVGELHLLSLAPGNASWRMKIRTLAT